MQIIICVLDCREAPEATGDEPDDADLDAPKIYEEVSALSSSE